MGPTRVIGLVAFVGAAVAVFLVAPVDGRFAQSPCLLLIAVLALIWHLALSDGGVRPTSSVSHPTPPSSAHDPATLPDAASAPSQESVGAGSEDLSLLPDPPANWPPPGVDVPLVFRSVGGDQAISPPTESSDRVIDLRSADTDSGLVIDLTEPDPAGTPNSETVRVEPDLGDDPWLAFAASMFRDG